MVFQKVYFQIFGLADQVICWDRARRAGSEREVRNESGYRKLLNAGFRKGNLQSETCAIWKLEFTLGCDSWPKYS
jgi:hypothetical protein